MKTLFGIIINCAHAQKLELGTMTIVQVEHYSPENEISLAEKTLDTGEYCFEFAIQNCGSIYVAGLWYKNKDYAIISLFGKHFKLKAVMS